MFTGIIETIGEVHNIVHGGSIMTLVVASPISAELTPDQSVAHDGVCLTIVDATANTHTVQLVEETLLRSTFAGMKPGALLNLERSMPASGRFEGHIVQGHVDCVAQLITIENGIYTFSYPHRYATYLVEKGSICINGVSLTVATLDADTFGIALIPHTLAKTNLRRLLPGERVNIEFDILAKYMVRMQSK